MQVVAETTAFDILCNQVDSAFVLKCILDVTDEWVHYFCEESPFIEHCLYTPPSVDFCLLLVGLFFLIFSGSSTIFSVLALEEDASSSTDWFGVGIVLAS